MDLHLDPRRTLMIRDGSWSLAVWGIIIIIIHGIGLVKVRVPIPWYVLRPGTDFRATGTSGRQCQCPFQAAGNDIDRLTRSWLGKSSLNPM